MLARVRLGGSGSMPDGVMGVLKRHEPRVGPVSATKGWQQGLFLQEELVFPWSLSPMLT